MAGTITSSADAIALMQRETRRAHGLVPAALGQVEVAAGSNALSQDSFLLREEGFACLYRRGEGVTVQLDDPGAASALELYLVGSVHAAIAALNGLFPLHASAVVPVGSETAVAFTAPSGGGKSTLAVALAMRDHGLLCDDTLVLDTRTTPAACLPGNKPAKLWPDGRDLAGAAGEEVVSPAYPKVLAEGFTRFSGRTAQLGALVALEWGEEIDISPVTGAAKVLLLQDSHYTRHFRDLAGAADQRAYFETLGALAQTLPMYRFRRPRDPSVFARACDRFEEVLHTQILARRYP